MNVVNALENERLDSLCFRHYSHLRGAVEAVLAANPLLSEQPERLPQGLAVRMPALPDPQARRVRLW